MYCCYSEMSKVNGEQGGGEQVQSQTLLGSNLSYLGRDSKYLIVSEGLS